MSKSTPGPWRAEPYKGDGDPCYGILADERHSNLTREVAMVEHWSRGTAKANAELIALAPDLLELAEAFMAYLEDDSKSPRRRAACLSACRRVLKH